LLARIFKWPEFSSGPNFQIGPAGCQTTPTSPRSLNSRALVAAGNVGLNFRVNDPRNAFRDNIGPANHLQCNDHR
jgi:hypothetical protein